MSRLPSLSSLWAEEKEEEAKEEAEEEEEEEEAESVSEEEPEEKKSNENIEWAGKTKPNIMSSTLKVAAEDW